MREWIINKMMNWSNVTLCRIGVAISMVIFMGGVIFFYHAIEALIRFDDSAFIYMLGAMLLFDSAEEMIRTAKKFREIR